MTDLTVAQLIEALAKMPPDRIVRCWMPGQHISLSSVFPFGERTVLIEGNVTEAGTAGP